LIVRYSRDFRARQPGGRRTLTQQALAILARYGSAANLYLPGVGAINGITAGNWLDSIGMTATAVDNPTGLVVSAGKTVGPERVANGVFDSGITGWTPRRSSIATHSNGCLRCTNGGDMVSGGADTPIACEIGKTYRMSMRVAAVSAGMSAFFRVGDKPVDTATSADFRVSVQGVGVGVHSGVFVATQTTHYVFAQANQGTDGSWVEFDDFSVTELPGAHLTQATTANKPILRLSGNVHSWQLDGSNDHFSTSIATPSEGYYVGGALCTSSGVTHTIGGGSGGAGDADAGVWIARQSNGNIRISVGNGTTRNSLLSQNAPINSAFVASAGWSLSSIFTGVNNVEVSTPNAINCATSRQILVGATLVGASTPYLPMIGNLYAQLWILGTTPSASERATLRKFIASLSGVAL